MDVVVDEVEVAYEGVVYTTGDIWPGRLPAIECSLAVTPATNTCSDTTNVATMLSHAIFADFAD